MFSKQFCDDLSETLDLVTDRFSVTFSGKCSDMQRLYKNFTKHKSETTLGVITPDVFYLVCYDYSLSNLLVCSCPCKASGFGVISAVPSFYAIFSGTGQFSFEVDENLVAGTVGKNKARVEQGQVRTPVLRRMLRVLEPDGQEDMHQDMWEVLAASLASLSLDAYASAASRRLDVYVTTRFDGKCVSAFCGDDVHLGCVSKFVCNPLPEFRLCVSADSIKTMTVMFPPPKKRAGEDADEDDGGSVIDVANLVVTTVRNGLVFQGKRELLFVPNLETKEKLYTLIPDKLDALLPSMQDTAPRVGLEPRQLVAALKQFDTLLDDETLPVTLAMEEGNLVLGQAKAIGNTSLDIVLDAFETDDPDTSPVKADYRLLKEVASSLRNGQWEIYLGLDEHANVLAFNRADGGSMTVTYLIATQD